MPTDQTVIKIGTEFLVNTQTSGNQNYPVVTGLANGGFVVTWQDGLAAYNGSGSDTLGDSSYSSIKAQIYDANGNVVGTEFLVNSQTTGGQATPVITGLSDGGFVVAWQDQNSTSGDIKAQIYDASGNVVGTEFLVNTATANSQNTPTITALPDGGFVVAWSTVNPTYSSSDIKAQVYDANGAKVGSEFLVNSTSNYDQERSSITTLSNGDFVVTWNDFRTGNWEVRGQVFHPTSTGATKVGSEFIVDTAFYNSTITSPATGLANGNFIVTWEDTSGEIRGQVFNTTGVKVGSEFVVNTRTSGSQGFPDITALTNGGFVVTWHDEGTGDDGSGSSIKAQVYDADGHKVGGEYLVNSQPNSVQYYPTVAALADGGFVITWGDFSQAIGDASSYGIAAQIFNLSETPAAPTIVSVTDDVAPVAGTVVDGSSTNDNNLTVRIATGSNFAGDTVQLFDGTTALGTAVVLTIADIARGYIDLQTGTLTDAAHAITAKVTDASGLQSIAAPAVNVTVDTVAPTTAVTDYVIDTTDLPVVTVNGTTEANASVSVYDGETLVGTVTAGNDGSWSLSGVTLAEGTNSLSATATDAAGNAGASDPIAAATVVSTSNVDVEASTTTDYIVYGEGVLNLYPETTAPGEIVIGNGGNVFDYGTTTDVTVLSGGALHVFHGGSAANTVIEAGGYVDVWDASTVTNTSLSGNQQIADGGTAIDTTIENGGSQYIAAGGTADGTVIHTGGFQYVDAGAAATDTVVDGGYQIVVGTATGGEGNGGGTISYGVSTDATIGNGGAQHVYYGGSAVHTTVEAGGFQDIFDATVTDTILSGNQQVLAGGTAIGTQIAAGGGSYVGAGGTANGSVIAAGGIQYVDAGASAGDTTVAGGFLFVGGTATDTSLISGTEVVDAGGIQNGIDFGGGAAATLYLANASGLTGTISNFEVGDVIDILNLHDPLFGFTATSIVFATDNGNVTFHFADKQANTVWHIADDGNGGTQISLSLISQFSASLVSDGGSEGSLVPQDTTVPETTLTGVHA